MFITSSNILLIGSIILFVSILISKTGSRFGVPSLLLFLIVGMFFGCDGLGIQFDNIKSAQFIGMIALSIILFSGGMDTQMDEIKQVMWHGFALSTLGVLLTTVITGLFIFLITKCFDTAFKGSLALCMLLAATMSSTDSASVFSILRGQKIGLRKHTKPMLELESGSNDPMAYMLTIALIQICQTSPAGAGSIIANFFIQFIVGIVMGLLCGMAIVWIINKINLNNVSLYPIVLICLVFITFSFTEAFHGNGYLAVYLAGMVTGNRPLVKKRECAKFLDGITWLLQIVMFLILGLLVVPSQMTSIAIFATAIGLFMIFIGRPLAVFLTLLPFKKPEFKARVLVSWVGLRGATPIIFATYPVVANVPGAQQIFNIVFFITLLSLILQGTTIPWVAKKLDMIREVPKEGNDFGVELPEEIDSKLWDIDVTAKMLKGGNQLKDMHIPSGVLIIMIRRGGKILIPNGTLEIMEGDKLLVLSQSDSDQEHVLQP